MSWLERFVKYSLLSGLTIVVGDYSLASATEAAPAGTVTLAKVEGNAVAVWDASDAVAALVSRQYGKDEALRLLESDAARILITRAPTLAKRATTLTVTVIYKKTGAVSPQYQIATFEGLERLLYVKGAITDATAANNSWVGDLQDAKPPKNLEIVVTGSLPDDFR